LGTAAIEPLISRLQKQMPTLFKLRLQLRSPVLSIANRILHVIKSIKHQINSRNRQVHVPITQSNIVARNAAAAPWKYATKERAQISDGQIVA